MTARDATHGRQSRDRVREQFSHVLWPDAAKIDNLMPATRAGSDHNIGLLIVDLAQ